jgi:tetratricopeptide (TPR) repeat protein
MREDLRWYLEDYLIAPFAVYEERGQQIRMRLRQWGETLFNSIFGPGQPGRDAYLQAQGGPPELSLISRSPTFLALPWELVKDPARETPLVLAMPAFDRTVSIAGASTPVPPGDVLRVMMVIARPAGSKDVGYQMVARPLMERLGAVRGKVELDVLRPPTLQALDETLRAAADAGTPYHILHFDGHGTFGVQRPAGSHSQHQLDAATSERGFLFFEKAGGGEDLVSADTFALTVSQGQVPLVVLNACRSGMLGETAVEAAVATRLLEGGAASVVAMGYSVYAVAAAEFMAAFYEALFSGETVSAAVAAGRHRLFQNKLRPSPKGQLELEDWMVPVHYLRRLICFPQLQLSRPKALPPLDALLDQARRHGDGSAADDALAPDRRFIGRDAVFYGLERALTRQPVVVVHGTAGTGKTELAKAFGRWWRDTGGVEQPEWVFFYSFQPGLASFGLDGVVTEIGLRLFGSDFIGKTKDAAQRAELLLKVLRERRMLLLWDNFESVFTLPDPTGATPPLDAAEQQRMQKFLTALARDGGKSRVIITSRTREGWVGDVRRVELRGLTPAEAALMAEDVLQPYPVGRQRRQERAFAQLLEWLNGHPLSLRLLLPQLEQTPPAVLLEALKGNTANLPPGFLGEERTAALGASLKYSLDRLPDEDQAHASALALFEGVADEDVLGLFSAAEGVPTRYAGAAKTAWSALLQRLASMGVVTALGSGIYSLHPALPAGLTAAWRQAAGDAFAAEHKAAERALLDAYAVRGDWLYRQIRSGSAEMAFAVIDCQRRTMGRLLGLALAERRYTQAQSLLVTLDAFWVAAGLTDEGRDWVDRCRQVLEAADGMPPAVESEAGALWLFAVGSEASRAIEAGRLDAAHDTYDMIRQRLETAKEDSRRPQLASTYYQLGRVAQHRGQLDDADRWHQRSLEIRETLGDRLGVAGSYKLLGGVAQDRGQLDDAERYYRRSLEIDEALGNRLGMASSYHDLGIVAQRCGQLDDAERYYRRSLEINETLGTRPDMASSYHQLGMDGGAGPRPA